MLKRIAAYWFYLAYRKTLWDFAEEIKREFIEKGWARGKEAPRTGLPFALILTRGDEVSQPASVIGAQGSGYRWWGCVDPANGHEVMLGTLEEVDVPTALQRYAVAVLSTLGAEKAYSTDSWKAWRNLWITGTDVHAAPVPPPSDICPNCRSKVLPEDAALTGKCKSCGYAIGLGQRDRDHLGQPVDSVGE